MILELKNLGVFDLETTGRPCCATRSSIAVIRIDPEDARRQTYASPGADSRRGDAVHGFWLRTSRGFRVSRGSRTSRRLSGCGPRGVQRATVRRAPLGPGVPGLRARSRARSGVSSTHDDLHGPRDLTAAVRWPGPRPRGSPRRRPTRTRRACSTPARTVSDLPERRRSRPWSNPVPPGRSTRREVRAARGEVVFAFSKPKGRALTGSRVQRLPGGS
jgi:hypothetical protein